MAYDYVPAGAAATANAPAGRCLDLIVSRGCLRPFDKLRVAPSIVEGRLRSGQESLDLHPE